MAHTSIFAVLPGRCGQPTLIGIMIFPWRCKQFATTRNGSSTLLWETPVKCTMPRYTEILGWQQGSLRYAHRVTTISWEMLLTRCGSIYSLHTEITENSQVNKKASMQGFQQQECALKMHLEIWARFRQLLHLDFFVVDKINVFVISCCVLHNLCIKAGVEDIPFDPEDTGSDCTWQRLSHDDRESSGPQTAKETVLRQMGEQKRESVRQKMGLQWATWRPPAKFWTCKWSAQHTCENELFILCFLERRVEGERKVCRFWDRVRLVRVPFFRYASLLASWCFRVSASLFPVA